jgi:hypothetical protein
MPKSVRNRYGKRAGLGVRTQYRTLGDDSPEYEPGVNGYEFDVTLYFKFEF